jgi:hypothetical protein
MIKYLLVNLCLFYSVFILAQPEGKLFLHTGQQTVNQKGKLGYITYPGGSYVLIDSINATDFIFIGDSIYVADGNVHIYNKITNLLAGNIAITDARKLAHWNNQLIVLSVISPHFRVYDLSSHALIYSLDSLDISYIPSDIHISNDKAFMILNDSMIVVDLILQNVETKFYTPHPYINAGSNISMVEHGNLLYIDVTYFTGVSRMSLISVDKTTYAVNTVFHQEGVDVISRPVVAGDSIYISFYNSVYDIIQDTFYVSTGTSHISVEHDSVSNSVFVFGFSGQQLSYYYNGIQSSAITLPGYYTKFIFQPGNLTTTPEVPQTTFIIFPNPASEFLQIDFGQTRKINSVEIIDSQGRLVYFNNVNSSFKYLDVNLRGYASGNYLISVNADGKFIKKKFVLNK